MEQKRSVGEVMWPPVREFVAGSFAGVGLILSGYPFDTIKVRLQSEGGYGRFKGPIHCLTTTLKEESFFGLYKGAMGPLLGQGAISAMQFSIFASMMPFVQKAGMNDWNLPKLIPQPPGRPAMVEVFGSGLMTGVFMFLLVTPIEGVKARLQVQYSEKFAGHKPRYSGTVDCYRQIWNQSGIKGLYRGAVPTMITRLAFGSYMVGYEGTRRILTHGTPDGQLSVGSTLLAGGVAGTLFWLTIYPFDVIKNKIQATPDVNPPIYKGMVDCGRQIYQKEGWKGFTRGLSVCLIRSLPANATTFLFLEIAKWALPVKLF